MPAGAVFLKSARSVNSKNLKIMLNTVFKFIRVAEIVIGKHWKTLSRVLKLKLICRGFGLLARAGVATAYLIYKTVH